ncbi:MAG TPA: carboxypeptidase regulatory-like domain-containing protein, partial [Terriglobia bacterium]|nr:carboxypeptidase regulatory-like domain-containing protein [Terriglobia bacterium]
MKSNTSWSSTWLKGMQACPKFLLAFFLTFAFLLPPDLTAQTFYGAISGTVTDPSGSLIPNATVTAINPATNEKHSVTTGTEGEYRIVSLLPAPYKLEVIAPSFKRFVQDIVTVQVGTTTTLNAKLEVGATTETIEVNTEAPLLQTESGSVGSQVEGKVVQEMPLNGRNVMNLLALVPGVVPEQNTQGAPAINGGIHLVTSGWGNYSIGGGIANESTQYIDGAPNNVMGGNPPALIMTQDMVQEFKVESNSVSAEYGHFGGGVVNMTSKSGTNAFHGGLYEYVRNTVLNTNDFISKNSGLKKAPYHQNQYGAIVGGPIKRDKAFFQFSWEDQSIHYSSGKQQYVPTLAERGEDSDNFPGGAAIKNALHDDDGKIATACGTTTPAILSGYDTADGYEAFIPESCIDGVAKIMKGYYAYPNTSLAGGAVNYVNQPLSGADSYQYNTRIDYAVSDKQRIFGRWTKWNIMTIAEDDFKGHEGHDPAVPSDYGANKNTTNNLVVGDTYTFNANTIGDLRLSYMRDHFKNFGSAFDSYDVSKLPGDWSIIAPQLGHKGTPAFGPLIGAQESGPWDIPVAAAQVDVYQAFGFNASLTKIVGRHSFKVGEETQLRIHGGIGNGAPFGSQAFFLPNVGDTWGAFMLGDLTNITIANVNETNTINWSHGAYLADTWRVNPKLTINYGIHWEYPGGIYEKKNRATVFLPDAYDSTNGTTASSPYPYLP